MPASRLPDGDWQRWEGRELLHGPRWVTVHAALHELPIFVRGAINPLAPHMQHTGQCNWHNLTLHVFPHGSSSFTLTPPDAPPISITCRADTDGVHLTYKAPSLLGTMRLHNIAAKRITINGKHVSWRENASDVIIKTSLRYDLGVSWQTASCSTWRFQSTSCSP